MSSQSREITEGQNNERKYHYEISNFNQSGERKGLFYENQNFSRKTHHLREDIL